MYDPIDGRAKTVDEKTEAVKSVLYHNLDHPDSSLNEKIMYHQYCGSWCQFKQHVSLGKLPENLKKNTY